MTPESPDAPRGAHPAPRLGIFCDYGSTLWPDTGIGVFVYNLIDGLERVAPEVQITVQCRPGDQGRLRRLMRKRGWRAKVAPPEQGWRDRVRRIVGSRERLQQRVDRAYAVWESCQTAVELRRIHWPQRFRAASRSWLKYLWSSWSTAPRRFAPWPLLLSAMTLAALPIVWLLVGLYYLLSEFVAPVLLRPAGWMLAAAQRGLARAAGGPREPRPQVDCDAWLVPHAGTPAAFDRPYVLGAWDLVHHHVPGVFTPEQAAITNRRFEDRVREADVIFCGATHVLEQDLKRVYPRARERMRLLRLAPPADFASAERPASWEKLRERHDLAPEYLLYPASFGAHKNHARLVKALALVRRARRYSRVQLVLTGAPVPPALRQLISDRGLDDAVRLVGRVERGELDLLYRHATLVPLPSLHEGYGLPLLETLAHDVPMVCSDIPAFRELLAGHDDAVLFFDPRRERFLADAIVRTLDERHEWRQRQRAVWRDWSQRTWDDVARDFLILFDEARGARQAPPRAQAA